jgi:hypothetical protein
VSGRGARRWHSKPSNQRSQSISPDALGLGLRHAPAELHRRQSLAQRVKRARCLFRGTGPKETCLTEAADAADQTRECLRSGTTETTCQLRRRKGVLDGDPEEPGVLDRELTKDRNASLDQIRGRVISRGERRHTRSEGVERARTKGDQEAFLGIVNAIHSARTRANPAGHGPH